MKIRNANFKIVLLNFAFYKKYSAHLFVRTHLVEKNKNLSVIRTPHYYNTKLIILFFIRTSNFCLRLDAQNTDTHTRLKLFLYFFSSLISLKNTCKCIDYQCVEHLSYFCMLCTLQTEKFRRTSNF